MTTETNAAPGGLTKEQFNAVSWAASEAELQGVTDYGVALRALLAAPKAAEQAPVADAARGEPVWRCFHCDEMFTDVNAAREHFGSSLAQEPACQIDVAEYRAMEERVRRCNEEDSDLHREIHRLHAQHHVEQQMEEEKGYARGLQDQKAETLRWAVRRWEAEVSLRPLINVNRRALDDTWRQIVRYCDGDAAALLGPKHGELLAQQPARASEAGKAAGDEDESDSMFTPAHAAWEKRQTFIPSLIGSWPWLRGVINGIPKREEFLGGQRTRYVQLDEVLAWIDEGEKRAAQTAQQAVTLTDDAFKRLVAHHAALLDDNAYCYFELAYTRQTAWMAWITDRPAQGDPGTPAYAKSRKVIARGQGDTPEDACADALAALQSQGDQ